MPASSSYLKLILSQLRKLREEACITPSQLEEKLILGPGWIDCFEQGRAIPSLDMLLAILNVLGKNIVELIKDIPDHLNIAEIERCTYAQQNGNDLDIHFKYANFDAIYTLKNANLDQFEDVIKTLRDGLSRLVSSDSRSSESIKTDAVAKTFLHATQLWPKANPSDIWWFLIYRAYCDPFNHPARFSRLDFTQSWKRTGGWALEEVLVRHYGPYLKQNGIELLIASNEEKEYYIKSIKVKERLESDKMDVLLIGERNRKKHFFGVVHVKASFAERRTDDVPMSKALVSSGYLSPLWTMDCKGSPSTKPFNKGELGDSLGEKIDKRSAKRKDIEDDGYFSACFSYNSNTKITPLNQKAAARIYVCNLSNPRDEFTNFIISSWKNFQLA